MPDWTRPLFFSIIVEQEAQAYTSTRTHAVKLSMRGSLTRNQWPDLLVTNWPISTPLRPYVCFASCDRKIIIEGEEGLLLDCVNIIWYYNLNGPEIGAWAMEAGHGSWRCRLSKYLVTRRAGNYSANSARLLPKWPVSAPKVVWVCYWLKKKNISEFLIQSSSFNPQ